MREFLRMLEKALRCDSLPFEILRTAIHLAGADMGAVLIHTQGRYSVAAFIGMDPDGFPLSELTARLNAAGRTATEVSSLSVSWRPRPNILLLPAVLENRAVALIYLERMPERQLFSSSDRARLEPLLRCACALGGTYQVSQQLNVG